MSIKKYSDDKIIIDGDTLELMGLALERAWEIYSELDRSEEVVPTIERVVVDHDNVGVKVDTNISETTGELNIEMLKDAVDIPLEECTKEQLTTMLISAVAIISAIDMTENQTNTDAVCHTIKSIYYQGDGTAVEESGSHYDEDIFCNSKALADFMKKYHNAKNVSNINNEKFTVCKKEMEEEATANSDNFNKTVDEIIENFENKIAEAKEEFQIAMQILEENENMLNELRNEVPNTKNRR
jgi:hypothetical protein